MHKKWPAFLTAIGWLIAVVAAAMNYSGQIQLSSFWRGFFYTLGALGPITLIAVYLYLRNRKNQQSHG
ncbi:hypothetical protein [Lewinella sp. W8]|uniref:hypothetical protein n=1 Tax=Lewinella sp. W8 TaxID=2528208 RepID=UPI001068A659|nr:hypothetical protein [Lewinella sp. W8]MTB51586.1 hypothetical protein [Lewinella sp. W8]